MGSTTALDMMRREVDLLEAQLLEIESVAVDARQAIIFVIAAKMIVIAEAEEAGAI